MAASYAVDPKTGAFAIQLGQCPCLARVCVVCHKQETGPLHECEMDQKRVEAAAAAKAAAKAAAAAPVDRASEQYMASIGKRCDLIALLVAKLACISINPPWQLCMTVALLCAGALRAAYSSRAPAAATT